MAEAVISCLPKLKKNNFLLSEEYINFLKKKAVVPGRQELLIGKNNVNLIDDTYNANPESFRAAFKKIKSMSCKNKICVMGKMNELGEKTLLLQDEVIEDALSVFDLVLAIDLDSNIKDENFKIIDSKAIYKNLEIYLNEESVILFKASRSVKMEKIVKLFK